MNDGMTPKVSVIICTYNQKTKIARALKSVLASDGFAPGEMEVIVADDASTDGTAEAATEAAGGDGRVRVIKREGNLGLVRNYFAALKEARGEYIADVAGDDAWTSITRLARSADILDNNPGITMVHTGWTEVDEATGKRRERGARNVAGTARERLLNLLERKDGACPHLSTTLYRKPVIDKAREEHPELFDSERLACEDMQVLAFLLTQGDAAYIDETTLDYTVEPGTVSVPNSARKAAKFYCGVVWLMEKLRGIEGIDRRELMEYYNGAARYAAGMARRERDAESARKIKETWGELGIRMPAVARLNLWLARISAARGACGNTPRGGCGC
ncbi:MAG: glycosyltransferase [Muribaculaceae bacterium]|nr:glycosyltransferase [Muribaculaceae bacterium]